MRVALKYRQKGLTSVEFAMVGLVALTALFGAIEVARLLFTVNMLEEATRRGARVATVCTVDSPAIARAAVFNSSGSGASGRVLPSLTTANIKVQYLNAAGVPVTGYTGGTQQSNANYLSIDYVRVEIVNFSYHFILPGYEISFVTNSYATTLPRESLGVPKPDQTSVCV